MCIRDSIGSNDGTVYALNASNGTKKWSFAADKVIGGQSPILSKDGAVLYISSGTYVYALNAVNGIKIWSTFIEGSQPNVKVTPALSPDGKTVYVGSTDYNVYALNAVDGTKKWNYLTEGHVGAPTVSKDGKVLYVGSEDKKMYAIDTGACEKSASTSSSCNGHGSMGSTGKCSCDEGWTGDNCEKSASTSSPCNGHGSMGSTGKCSCDEGWTGTACTNSSPSGTSTNKFDSIAWALLAMIAVISTFFLVRKLYHDYSTRIFDDEEQGAGYNRLGDGFSSSFIPHANDVVSRERFKSVEIQRLRNLVLESKE